MSRIAAFALLLFAFPALAADAPPLINYQGVLRGAADEPLTGNFDMVFRFFDAESAGNEILIDRHMTLNAKPVMVDGGLFSVALGGGLVVDGSGPGIFTSLADLFRDQAGVWLEVTIGAETLAPRTRIQSAPYALHATSAVSASSASLATDSSQLAGHPASFYLDTSSTSQYKAGATRFTSADPNMYALEAIASPGSPGAFGAWSATASCTLARGATGAECGGTSFGGLFYDTNESSWAYAGYSVYGLYSFGPAYGLYTSASNSSGVGVFTSAPQYGIYSTASGTGGVAGYFSGPQYGLYAAATGTSGSAGYFTQPGLPGTYTKIAYSGYGLMTQSYNGIHQIDYNDGGYARVGAAPYKINGTGAVSFVQNHPDDPDKVVVYHAPESSEVNVYTRGSAKLENGVARVELEPSFAWTANPDLGLTAHLTPRGEAVPLAVVSVSATEVVVRGPRGSDVEFDYWVTGLRIGFEEMAPVKRKELDSAIPRNASAAEVYAANPELRSFNALERHRAIGKKVGRHVDPDLRASAALRDRIGLSRPQALPDEPGVAVQAIDGPAEFAAVGGMPVPPAPSPRGSSGGPPVQTGETSAQARQGMSERFAAASAIEAGDVVVIDTESRGSVRRSDRESDRTVVGIAVTSAIDGWVEVALGSVAEVRVDAGYGAIRSGDLLVSSPAPGAAMRATTAEPGTILGKALEPLESGLGTVRVLVMLR